jgi:hypothetical protein
METAVPAVGAEPLVPLMPCQDRKIALATGLAAD